MFFFYFFIVILYKTGTTDWSFLNFLVNSSVFFFNIEWVQIFFVTLVLILAIFLKLGTAPLHFFKVEIYDGIPILSILFYTTFYTSVFFIYIVYFFSYLNFTLFTYILYFFLYFLVFGLVYLVLNSIFNSQILKVFFAYSTILNISFFFIVFVVMFN